MTMDVTEHWDWLGWSNKVPCHIITVYFDNITAIAAKPCMYLVVT